MANICVHYELVDNDNSVLHSNDYQTVIDASDIINNWYTYQLTEETRIRFKCYSSENEIKQSDTVDWMIKSAIEHGFVKYRRVGKY